MAHKRAVSKARQAALDMIFQAMNELEGVVTEAESRDRRMSTAASAKAEEAKSRFPAMGVRR